MTNAGLELIRTPAMTPWSGATMKSLVYHGAGKSDWEDKPRPTIQEVGDALIRITTSTICGTDLHILKGDLPAVVDGRILAGCGKIVLSQQFLGRFELCGAFRASEALFFVLPSASKKRCSSVQRHYGPD